MKTYCTLPAAAAAEAEEPLSREVKVNAKTILGGVAATAFVLGMMAAAAARSSSSVGASQLSLVDHITALSDDPIYDQHDGGKSPKDIPPEKWHKIRLARKHFSWGGDVCLGVDPFSESGRSGGHVTTEIGPGDLGWDDDLPDHTLVLVDCRGAPSFLWYYINDVWKLTYNGLCLEADDFYYLDGDGFSFKPCADTAAQHVAYYGNENQKFHASLSHYEQGDCLVVTSGLGLGRHVERAACDDDDPDIYSDWIME